MSNEKMRADFEAWAKERGYQRDELDRCRTGVVGPAYYNLNTEMAWAAWQAALATQRQAEPVDGGDYYSEEADDIEKSRARAAAEEVMARLTTFLEAQDALDNRELMGPNAEDYFTLIKRRNAARKHLDAAMQKDTQ